MSTGPIGARFSRGARRMVSAAVLAVAAWPALAAPAAGPAECRPAPPTGDSIASVGARGEMRLSSGGKAVLGSVRWPDEPATAAAAYRFLAEFRGRPLVVTARGEPDRWGRRRIDARLSDGDGAAEADLAEGLVAAGLAFAEADEGDVLCRPSLLALEDAPRAAGTGVWAEPVAAAGDGPALRARAGRFTVVSGRLLHVGERRARIYLDFARRGEDGLTVIVSKRTWRRLLERGLTAAGLTGRTVRARGIVEIRRGPTLDIASAEAIQVLDDRDPAGVRAAPEGGEAEGERAPRR